ncbi:hypothetical protein JAAARDRAFT_52334 [Jaapia argillacea MUCL 33604]|uniref:Uncharacterized protein n=1 Tax=Jaapia argillacea MUCL 33604 TaxID=933084 RepID=A0A067QE02_9AGAM|nr:hypothetical protein JAAARDRAFT_52334 [Jaapia argillacea MUCL 33604]
MSILNDPLNNREIQEPSSRFFAPSVNIMGNEVGEDACVAPHDHHYQRDTQLSVLDTGLDHRAPSRGEFALSRGDKASLESSGYESDATEVTLNDPDEKSLFNTSESATCVADTNSATRFPKHASPILSTPLSRSPPKKKPSRSPPPLSASYTALTSDGTKSRLYAPCRPSTWTNSKNLTSEKLNQASTPADPHVVGSKSSKRSRTRKSLEVIGGDKILEPPQAKEKSHITFVRSRQPTNEPPPSKPPLLLPPQVRIRSPTAEGYTPPPQTPFPILSDPSTSSYFLHPHRSPSYHGNTPLNLQAMSESEAKVELPELIRRMMGEPERAGAMHLSMHAVQKARKQGRFSEGAAKVREWLTPSPASGLQSSGSVELGIGSSSRAEEGQLSKGKGRDSMPRMVHTRRHTEFGPVPHIGALNRLDGGRVGESSQKKEHVDDLQRKERARGAVGIRVSHSSDGLEEGKKMPRPSEASQEMAYGFKIRPPVHAQVPFSLFFADSPAVPLPSSGPSKDHPRVPQTGPLSTFTTAGSTVGEHRLQSRDLSLDEIMGVLHRSRTAFSDPTMYNYVRSQLGSGAARGRGVVSDGGGSDSEGRTSSHDYVAPGPSVFARRSSLEPPTPSVAAASSPSRPSSRLSCRQDDIRASSKSPNSAGTDRRRKSATPPARSSSRDSRRLDQDGASSQAEPDPAPSSSTESEATSSPSKGISGIIRLRSASTSKSPTRVPRPVCCLSPPLTTTVMTFPLPCSDVQTDLRLSPISTDINLPPSSGAEYADQVGAGSKGGPSAGRQDGGASATELTALLDVLYADQQLEEARNEKEASEGWISAHL